MQCSRPHCSKQANNGPRLDSASEPPKKAVGQTVKPQVQGKASFPEASGSASRQVIGQRAASLSYLSQGQTMK